MRAIHRSAQARLWVAACTLLAAGLRAWDLAGQSLWSDEDITLDRARTALGAMLAGLPGEHAPLYFVLLRGWTRLAGDTDLALRFPSLLAGVVAVPLGYAVARRLTDSPTALATALLLAVNPFLVSYGQEARMYAQLGALSLAAIAAALAADRRARAGRPALGVWLACGALTAATVYTHYFGVLVAVTLAAWGLPDAVALARRRPMTAASRQAALARGWLTAGAVAAALFAPWLPRALRVTDHPGWRVELPLWRVPDTLALAWSAQTGVTAGRPADGWAIAATVLAVALMVVGVAAWGRRARGDVGMPTTGRVGARRALAWLVAMAVVATIALVRKPDYHPRYFIPFVGVWFMAIAAGARDLGRRFGAVGWLPLAALVALSGPALMGYYADPAQRKTDYRRLVNTVLDAAPADSSRLFLDGPSLGIAERYVPGGMDLKIENLQSDKNSALRRDDRAAFEARIDELARRRPNAWLATDGAALGWADGWLAANAFPVASTAVGDVTLERWFVTTPMTATSAADPTAVRQAKSGSSSGGDEDLSEFDTTPPWRLWLVGPAHEWLPDGAEGVDAPIVLTTVSDMIPRRVIAGQVWPISLTWKPVGASGDATSWSSIAPAQRPHNVSVRLVDTAGTIVAHADREPAAGTAPTTTWSVHDPVFDRHGLLVPVSTPPGAYQLAVVLYDAATLAPTLTWSHVADVTVRPAP